MSQKDGHFWWEKTVEYAFVRNIIPELSRAFPLDGNIEKALGDLLLQDGTMIRLIEFKSEKSNIQREKKKWGLEKDEHAEITENEFQKMLLKEYSEEIKKYPGHKAHWLIYGEHTGLDLKLAAQEYWGENSTIHSLENCDHLENLAAVDRHDMFSYLRFLEFERGSSSSGNEGLVIVGVSGGATLSLGAEDFSKLCPEHKEALTEEPGADTHQSTKKNAPKI